MEGGTAATEPPLLRKEGNRNMFVPSPWSDCLGGFLFLPEDGVRIDLGRASCWEINAQSGHGQKG